MSGYFDQSARSIESRCVVKVQMTFLEVFVYMIHDSLLKQAFNISIKFHGIRYVIFCQSI